jgi:hypothetical protein
MPRNSKPHYRTVMPVSTIGALLGVEDRDDDGAGSQRSTGQASAIARKRDEAARRAEGLVYPDDHSRRACFYQEQGFGDLHGRHCRAASACRAGAGLPRQKT